MIRRIEPLNGVIMNITLYENGFANVSVSHSACDASSSYAFGLLGTEAEQFEYDDCGNLLFKITKEDGDEVPSAVEL